jgi:hypothetical protein
MTGFGPEGPMNAKGSRAWLRCPLPLALYEFRHTLHSSYMNRERTGKLLPTNIGSREVRRR